ncbi:hypothetical protein HPB47_024971 [Ixodes persulcatus]|uniref:Uncharacterized protein n=1 Tax=Ixodes persulcatus TaxID=34615 RepID=A0AC60Q302_IXOPE|nr:hypothetical protein HPB47_024971 [Ixodes persulcatus]
MAKCRMIGAAYDFAWRDEKVKLAESFSEFKRLALAYFDTDPPSVRLTRFLEARQRPEEEVRAFASRLQALGYDTLSMDDAGGAERAKYAKEFLHEQMRSQFVSSLRDPVRRYVLSKNPATFEAAVEAAVHEERNESLTVREERVRVVAAEVQPENREIAQLTERLDRLEHLFSQQTKHERGATSAQEQYRGNQTQGRREGQLLAGSRRGKPEKKQLAVPGKKTDTRDAEKVRSLEKDSKDARPLERRPRERRDDARERVTAETEEGHRLGAGSAAGPLRALKAPKRCTAGHVCPVSSKPE